MPASNHHHIQIPGRWISPKQDMFEALARLLPVEFSDLDGALEVGAGQILVENQGVSDPLVRRPAAIQLVLPGLQNSHPGDRLMELNVRFSDDAEVPSPFRGRSLTAKVAEPIRELHVSDADKILATSEYGPVWLVTRESLSKKYRTCLSLPLSSTLLDVMNGDCAVAMLPLLHFLREVCRDGMFELPPLRACFIFDDPNLHWPQYGFVKYPEIAAHAKKENYHVSFATIPLDMWFAHAPTVEIFRNHADRLSLCVHGNDHTKRELAEDYAQSSRIALLRQAIQRTERLERKTGLPVSRVMVPPHGACLEDMLAEMGGCGFESACISHGSLVALNGDKAWTKNLGYLPSELIRGFPVMPRWAMIGWSAQTMLWAAYLGQPLILRGHHQDLKGGIEVLDEFARLINSLGNVAWANMADLSRMNYQSRVEGATCRLKPMGRKIVFRVPEGVTNLIVEGVGDGGHEEWQVTSVDGKTQKVRQLNHLTLTPGTMNRLLVEACDFQPQLSEPTSRRTPVQAVVRRLLTEARDRLKMN